ncbi:LOW QUALITY PROTEIN: uncharacterized protein [Argopecten irradians]|uniref:LOW QUALITY PROTEIN: uncharacterized protein n=1 Tax=Argopecten irradians TaxID=31199 RepID=UPI003717111A
MNLCNFSKVFISRSSKDNTCVEWFDNANAKNCRNTENEASKPTPVYDNDLSIQKRHEIYQRFVANYPKLHITYAKFRSVLPRIQTAISKDGNWINSNKTGEKNAFLKHYSLQSFFQQNVSSRKNHVLNDCRECIDTDHTLNRLLQKNPKTNIDLYNVCESLSSSLNSTSTAASPNSEINPFVAATHIINAIKPALTKQFDTSFDVAITKVSSLNVQVKQTENEKKQQKQQHVKDNLRKSCTVAYGDNEDNVINFLASGTSFSQYERTRLNTYYEKSDKCKEKVEKRLKKENDGACNKRTAIGETPANGGQVLKLFAEANGFPVDSFNTDRAVSGRDYPRRIRRRKKKIFNFSLPSPPTSKNIRRSIKEMVANGELDMGELVAPKVFETQVLQMDGTMVSKNITIHARKISLTNIHHMELKRHNELGIYRSFSDDHYANLSQDEIQHRFQRMSCEISCQNLSTEDQRTLLKKLERTRHWKIWHDHSDIANHSHFLIMVCALYNTSCFLTDEEYKSKHPGCKSSDVQGMVEVPQLYLLGRSGSSDADQMMYTEERLNDIHHMTEPIQTPAGIPVYDVCRIFSGDGPARQFESGQQRGGNYPCLCGVHAENFGNIQNCYSPVHTMSLEERRKLVTAGTLWPQETKRDINFHATEDIIKELDARRIFPESDNKQDLQQTLNTTLHGIARPPALLALHPAQSVPTSLESYEVMTTEPLHDLTGVINNFLQELPHHCPNAKSTLESFVKMSVGTKSQTKGCDARLFMIKLLSLAYSLEKSNQIDHYIVEMVECLVEMTEICYSTDNKRNPRQVLRLYNLSFKFFVLCRSVFCNIKTMSKRRFFGSHFHSITCHTAEMYRVVCLRSILAEKEERMFGEIRTLTKTTSNQHPSNIIGNAILRNQARKHQPNQSFNHQDSAISKQASLLPAFGNTVFSKSITDNTSLFQSHLERIADFLLRGKGTWWQFCGSGIEFLDGPTESKYKESGPSVESFISTSLKKRKRTLSQCWSQCLESACAGKLELPAKRLRVNNRVINLPRPETERIPASPYHGDTSTIILQEGGDTMENNGERIPASSCNDDTNTVIQQEVGDAIQSFEATENNLLSPGHNVTCKAQLSKIRDAILCHEEIKEHHGKNDREEHKNMDYQDQGNFM